MLEGCCAAGACGTWSMRRRVPCTAREPKDAITVHDAVDHPVSLYAATKKSNELMAHVYSHLYGLPTTGLRFFTVYGPWGRPDRHFGCSRMRSSPAARLTFSITARCRRDFTYVDDIVEGVVRVADRVLPPIPTGRRLIRIRRRAFRPIEFTTLGIIDPSS